MHKRRIIVDAVLILIACVFTAFSLMTGAAPLGGMVQYGDITIGSDQSKGIDTLVTQTSQKGIINWQRFNINQGEHTHFAQPNASAVTLNRVTGGNISEILGQLTATGRIFLLNPSGILFGPTARVDVAGLIASTAAITDSDFLNGTYIFSQGPNNQARIINQGMISAKEGGMIALVAPAVENSGIITANLGKVILGSAPAGSSYTIDLYGDGLLQFALPSAVTENIKDAIIQSGNIRADGGTVLLSVDTAKGVVDRTINMSGIIEANTVVNRGGQIILSGGNGAIAEVSGQLKARGNRSGEKGGSVRVLTSKVALMDSAAIDVSGQAGGGEALIGGDYKGGGGVPTSEAVYVEKGAKILANAEETGNGGKIIVWSDNATRFYGTAEAKGGPLGGNGGFIETSSKNWLDVNGAQITTVAPAGAIGTWLLDPYDVYIVTVIVPPQNGGWSGGDPNTWVPTGTTSQILNSDIVTKLGSTAVVITTSGFGVDAGNITVNAPINYPGALSSLTLSADNNITVNQAIYGNLALYLNAAGTVTIGANLGSTNALSSLVVTAPSGIFLGPGGGVIKTTGSQTYNNAVTVAVYFNTSGGGGIAGGDINFVSTIDKNTDANAYYFDITPTGSLTFGGAVGGTYPLGRVAILNTGGTATTYINGGGVSTINVQAYYTPVILGADTTFNGQAVEFFSTVDSDSIASNLAINVGSYARFHDIVGGTNKLSSVDITPGARTIMYANASNKAGVYTTGSQVYRSGGANLAIELTNPFDITLDSTLGDITVAGVAPTSIGVNNLIINAGGIVNLQKDFGTSSNRLQSMDISALGGIQFDPAGGGTLSAYTTGAQAYHNAVTLGANTTFSAGDITHTSDIDFASTINSATSTPRNLYVNSTGVATFGGAIGATYPVNALSITANNGIDLIGGSVTTVGYGHFYSPILGGYDLTLYSNPSGGGGFVFHDIVGWDPVTSSIDPLTSLSVTASHGTYFEDSGGTVYTTGNQTYNNIGITISTDAFLQSTLGNILVQGRLVGSNKSLMIDAGGTITLGPVINMSSVLMTAPGGIFLSGGSVASSAYVGSSGSQQYSGPITLSGVNNIFAAGGPISFGDTLNVGSGSATITGSSISGSTIVGNSANSLTLGGPSQFVAIGSSVSPLGSVTTNVGAPLTLVAGSAATGVYTTGTQTYNDAITLGTNAIFSTIGGGDIDFMGVVSGPYNLILNTGGVGNILVNTGIGSSASPIGVMDIVNANNVIFNNVGVYVQGFSQEAGSGTTSFGNDRLHIFGGGVVRIATDTVNGHIIIYSDVGSLFLDVNYADLFGSIAGKKTKVEGILDYIDYPRNPLTGLPLRMVQGTQFFNGIDLYPYSVVISLGGQNFSPTSTIITEQAGLSEEDMHELGILYTSPAVELFAGQEMVADFLLLTAPMFECEESSVFNY